MSTVQPFDDSFAAKLIDSLSHIPVPDSFTQRDPDLHTVRMICFSELVFLSDLSMNNVL